MTFAATDSNSLYKTSYQLVKDRKCLSDVTVTHFNYRYFPMHGQSINQKIFVHNNSVLNNTKNSVINLQLIGRYLQN